MLLKYSQMPALLLIIAILSACSTITTKDCSVDMYQFGLNHGRLGSPKKYTDEIRRTCSSKTLSIDLEKYEKGFELGWQEYCGPSNALTLGKLSDPYVSFCPAAKESMFREKYLIGKRINELKDIESELLEELSDLRAAAVEGDVGPEEIKKRERDLVDLRKSITELEIEGLKDSLTLLNHL